MGIPGLMKYLGNRYLVKDVLKDCAVVIDGHNFFYKTYEDSEYPKAFGCESNRYAQYLKSIMDMFVKANVKCYIMFKGGYKNFDLKRFDVQNNVKNLWPVFMKCIWKEVLDELGFNYVACEFESKEEIIWYAQRHGYPIISLDAEYCFSRTQYIPSSTLTYNNSDRSIICRTFCLDSLLNEFNGLRRDGWWDSDKLEMFIVLTDQNIFERDYFVQFLINEGIQVPNQLRFTGLLNYLSIRSIETVSTKISDFLTSRDISTVQLTEARETARLLIRKEIPEGSSERFPSQYLNNGNNLRINRNDPDWFVKGVVCMHIAIPYIDRYHSRVVQGSAAISNIKYDDPVLLSIDIIQYALDLLTNFTNEGIKVISISEKSWLPNNSKAISITKPRYEAVDCVFENGWDHVRAMGLLEHFLRIKLPDVDLQKIERFPDDVRLLVIALIYFATKRNNCINTVVPSVLLSYVMLNVDNIVEGNQNEINMITNDHHKLAKNNLGDFFELPISEAGQIFDLKRLHPLLEFQHCLEELNFLNKLCGSPYRPTTYCKTFNGTFVYKVMHSIEIRQFDFIRYRLREAITVLTFFDTLHESFQEICNL